MHVFVWAHRPAPPPHTLPLPGCMWRSEDSSLVSILFFPLVKSQDQVQDFWACAQAPPLSCLIDLCFVYIFFLILKVGVLVVCACIVASCTYLCVPTLVPVETLNFILKSLYKYWWSREFGQHCSQPFVFEWSWRKRRWAKLYCCTLASVFISVQCIRSITLIIHC